MPIGGIALRRLSPIVPEPPGGFIVLSRLIWLQQPQIDGVLDGVRA